MEKALYSNFPPYLDFPIVIQSNSLELNNNLPTS